MVNKRTLWFLSISCLIFFTLPSYFSGVSAKIYDDTAVFTGYPVTSWETKHYVDPVTMEVRELQAQGVSDEQIVSKLATMGLGWDPETGSTWVGIRLSSEEAYARGLAKPDFGMSPLTDDKRTSVCRTSPVYYYGIKCSMKCGTMNIDPQNQATWLQYVTTQLGLFSYDPRSWTEVYVSHTSSGYLWMAYDNDVVQGGYFYNFGTKTSGTETYDSYEIRVTGFNYGRQEWGYAIYINQAFKLNGFLAQNSYSSFQAAYQKEIFSHTTGTFTSDSTNAAWQSSQLYDLELWNNWGSSITTELGAASPLTYSSGISSGCRYFNTITS